MGHRANFIIIRNGVAKAYYDQWAALGCVYTFAAGPEEACAAAEQMEPTTELMDWAFAEGGYLLDFDQYKAIGFGYPDDIGEFEDLDCQEVDEVLALQEINAAFERSSLDFLQHIVPHWTGWLLEWDDRGVDAFAAHLRSRGITTILTQVDSYPPDSKVVTYQA
ncbi:MAG: hypothetical protein AB1489_32070 [Acidobacteriota bacterium]